VQVKIHPRVEQDMNELHERFHRAFDRVATRMGNDAIDHWYKVMQQLDLLLREESA